MAFVPAPKRGAHGTKPRHIRLIAFEFASLQLAAPLARLQSPPRLVRDRSRPAGRGPIGRRLLRSSAEPPRGSKAGDRCAVPRHAPNGFGNNPRRYTSAPSDV